MPIQRDQAVEVLRRNEQGMILVVTGAGISSASGIPTFRGSEPGAVWRLDDVELATREYLQRDPVGQWSWYLDRFQSIDGARPNPAHQALQQLEEHVNRRGGDFLLVTQNIDCLHESAGSRELIKVHGSSDRLRCCDDHQCRLAAPRGSLARSEVDLGPFLARRDHDSLPRCPACGKVLRAHVLFFDEYYTEHVDYRFDEVEAAAAVSSAVVFIGTSFSVGVTDLVLRQALMRQRPVISIDPAGIDPALSSLGILAIEEPAEAALPAINVALGGASQTGH